MIPEPVGQALVAAVALVAAGHAGYYLRGVVDDYRMRRALVRINREVERGVERRGRLEA